MSEAAPGEQRAPRAERLWLSAAAALALVALAQRVHNAFAYPPLWDFDGPGHALNVLALRGGTLPDPNTWGGFHPPLAYALGALLWAVLPESVPVHVSLRLLSAAALTGAVAVAWRTLRHFVTPADAAVVAVLVLCTPVVAISSAMLGNEALGAFFVTLALARLCALPDAPARAPRHALGTGIVLAFGVLTKSTALVAVGAAALAYVFRVRRDLRRAALCVVLVGGVPALAVAPHAARLLAASGGSPLVLVSGAALTPEVSAEMRAQPPGERHLSDYLSLPAATFVAPVHRAPGLERSVPGMLYASAWADAHGQFLPASEPRLLRAAALLSLAGLGPTALALFGLVRLLRLPSARASAAGALVFAALLSVAFLRYTWVLPYYSAVKASYLLPALLPASLALASGLAASRTAGRTLLRGALLALSLYACFVTWQGWWT